MTHQGELFDARQHMRFEDLLAERFQTTLNGIVSLTEYPPYVMVGLNNTDTRRFDVDIEEGQVCSIGYDSETFGTGITRWRQRDVGSDTLQSGFLRGFPLLKEIEGDEIMPAMQIYDNYHDFVSTSVTFPTSAIQTVHIAPKEFSELTAELRLLQSGFAEVSNRLMVPVIKRSDGSEITRPAKLEDVEQAICRLQADWTEAVNEGLGTVASRFVPPTTQL